MEAKVVRWGDDFAVRLSAEEAERLGLSEGHTVEVTPKAEPHRRPTAEEMFAEMRRLGPDFEPPTVDWGPDRGSEIIDDADPR